MKKVSGALEAAADLRQLAKRCPRAMERSLFKYGNDRIKEAKDLTPVEFGDLKDSGSADEPQWEGESLTMELGFGGAAMDYAFIVHEDLEAYHDQGQAKYLETPLNRAEPNFDAEVGSNFAKFMGLE